MSTLIKAILTMMIVIILPFALLPWSPIPLYILCAVVFLGGVFGLVYWVGKCVIDIYLFIKR